VPPLSFEPEARPSLPGLSTTAAVTPADVQSAMALQSLRLRQDQGVPEWELRQP